MGPAAESGPGRRGRAEHAFFRWVSYGEQLVGACALLVIFVLVFIQALQRYLPVSGWLWTGELSQFCLVWLTFSVTGYLLGRGQHITLQVVDVIRAAWLLRWIKAFANAVVAVVAAGFVLEGYSLVTEHGQVSPALQMPMSWLYVIPLLGFALTAIRGMLGIVVPSVTAGGTAAHSDTAKDDL